jgi:hypothetical protein
MALDLAPSDRELCSQSTISRLENVPDARALLRMARAMVDLYFGSFRQVPKRIVLDIDDTFDAVQPSGCTSGDAAVHLGDGAIRKSRLNLPAGPPIGYKGCITLRPVKPMSQAP